jgi:hypothetical protein
MSKPFEVIDHKSRAHALLSASSSKRWLTCTPSARIEDQYPDTDTEYSKEGATAHELAQMYIEHWLYPDTRPLRETTVEEYRIYQEVLPYIDYIIERYQEAKHTYGACSILLEQRLDYSDYAPDGFGTGDVVLMYANTIEVIDLKFGKGVAVYAEENTQLRLYGLGAYKVYGDIYDPQTIKMTIHQPRLDHVTTEELAVEDLLDWAENVVRPAALKAYAGEGEYVTGDHCRFCKVAAICRARADENLALAQMEFRSADVLSPDEIAEVLTKAPGLSAWVNAVTEYALGQALAGVNFEGFKIVEGRSVRQYKDADEVVKRVLANDVPEAMIFEKKLITLTAMEKLIGKKKFPELLGALIIKPQGKPTLVPNDDPRPVFSSAATDFAEVKIDD